MYFIFVNKNKIDRNQRICTVLKFVFRFTEWIRFENREEAEKYSAFFAISSWLNVLLLCWIYIYFFHAHRCSQWIIIIILIIKSKTHNIIVYTIHFFPIHSKKESEKNKNHFMEHALWTMLNVCDQYFNCFISLFTRNNHFSSNKFVDFDKRKFTNGWIFLSMIGPVREWKKKIICSTLDFFVRNFSLTQQICLPSLVSKKCGKYTEKCTE